MTDVLKNKINQIQIVIVLPLLSINFRDICTCVDISGCLVNPSINPSCADLTGKGKDLPSK